MLISLCIPCHNRTYDLKRTMPYLVAAANYSPPVEICVLDYNSPDDLRDYFEKAMGTYTLVSGNSMLYRKYSGRDYYHMSHARNLATLMSSGEYFWTLSADIYLDDGAIEHARYLIGRYRYDWLQPNRYHGAIVCKRQTFIDAGGYDERLEWYGPEDRDLADRLIRRGERMGVFPGSMIHIIPTPDREKVKNYRLSLNKHKMSAQGHKIYQENVVNNVLVANSNGWGKWDEIQS
jgi:hypothetical protein